MNDLNKIRQLGLNDFQVHSKEVKYRGFFRIDEYQFKHQLFAGGESELVRREIFERGDAVVLVIFDRQSSQLLMIEQFRAGIIRSQETPWSLEFVAGMFDADESPVEVAVREALEEANIVIEPQHCHYINEFFPSPGGCSEKIFMYVGYCDLATYEGGNSYGLATEHEDILVHKLTLKQALGLLAEGKVNNATTIIGLQWLAMQFND